MPIARSEKDTSIVIESRQLPQDHIVSIIYNTPTNLGSQAVFSQSKRWSYSVSTHDTYWARAALLYLQLFRAKCVVRETTEQQSYTSCGDISITVLYHWRQRLDRLAPKPRNIPLLKDETTSKRIGGG